MLASVSFLVYSFQDVISLREHLNYLFLKENGKNIRKKLSRLFIEGSHRRQLDIFLHDLHFKRIG